jgi:hypothetical protein
VAAKPPVIIQELTKNDEINMIRRGAKAIRIGGICGI